ncbi:MAG: invasion associated locus B family protein [Pseudomonadota bacterium]
MLMPFSLACRGYSRCHGPAVGLIAALALLIALVTPVRAQDAGAAPSPAGPSAVLRGTYGAWQLYCRTPPGAREEKCAIVQMVTDEQRPNVGLNVQLFKSIGADTNMMRVVAPLGIFLPRGLGMKIDGEDVGNVPYIKCGKTSGCIAEFELQNEVVTKLKSGESALLIIFPTVEEGIGIPVSLDGFTKAFGTLK